MVCHLFYMTALRCALTDDLFTCSRHLQTSLVIGPIDNFFTAGQTASQHLGNNYSIGFQGTLESLPKGAFHPTLVVADCSVSNATLAWGDRLLQYAGNKTRSMAWTGKS